MRSVPAPYRKRQLLVCTNRRDPDAPKPSCAGNGGLDLRDRLKVKIKERGLKGTVIVTGTSCLDLCPAAGCMIGFQPDGEFFVVPTDEAGDDALIERLLG